ncbi:histone deacetylase family protein [Thiomicrospira sp.]|uniref:histone deacetylase family protein n=1 Tax=Thiomicrospira sp. TaxID=935 RepID=UPI002F9589CF
MFLYVSHPMCKQHNNGSGHPENAERFSRIEDALLSARLLDYVLSREARQASDEDILRVHTAHFLKVLSEAIPETGSVKLDEDTALSPQSLLAARYASGAVLEAVDAVLSGEVKRAFCNVRPPGHHAEVDRPMGFCLLNHVAIGAAYALEKYGLERVAILDIDVHHGNGTESYIRQEPRVHLISNFETDIYPFSPAVSDLPNELKLPMPAQTSGETWLQSWQQAWWFLEAAKPQLIFVSAGFDGHQMDPLAHWNLHEKDYQAWTQMLVEKANQLCEGRIISSLEGGYDLTSLGLSVVAHVKTLADL